MRVPRNEGVTNHVSPRAVRRSSRGVRRSVGSGSCGRAVEHRKGTCPGCRGFRIGRRQHRWPRYGEWSASPAVSENPCTHESLSSDNLDLGGLHPTSDSVPGSRREDRTVVAGDERGGGVRDERGGGVRLGHSSCEVGEQGDESPGGVDGAKDRGQREVNGPKHVPDAVPGSRDTGGLRATQACETASCRECG